MKATTLYHPSPVTLTLEMSGDEAKALKKLCGSITIEVINKRAILEGGPLHDDIRPISDAIHSALKEVR